VRNGLIMLIASNRDETFFLLLNPREGKFSKRVLELERKTN
jgi:hypothetical protein